MVPFEGALVSLYRLSIVSFPPCLRVSEILPLLFPKRHFPYPTSSRSFVNWCFVFCNFVVLCLHLRMRLFRLFNKCTVTVTVTVHISIVSYRSIFLVVTANNNVITANVTVITDAASLRYFVVYYSPQCMVV